LDNQAPKPPTSVSTRVSLIAIVAVLYAVGKGLTAFVPTPWGIGQLLVGIFIPAFFAVVAETVPVAIGAGLGTFIGDVIFLTPIGGTNPALSLIAGVPANFFAFLLFGWFVKRYRSWGGFVAATVSFVTLGNLIAATSVVLFGAYVFAPASVLSNFSIPGLILGFTVFWNMTSIPAIVIAVPLLVRAVTPLFGRSRILQAKPNWSLGVGGRQAGVSLAFAFLFLLVGLAYLVWAPNSIAIWPGLADYFALAAALVLIFAPIASVVAGTRVQARAPAP